MLADISAHLHIFPSSENYRKILTQVTSKLIIKIAKFASNVLLVKKFIFEIAEYMDEILLTC